MNQGLIKIRNKHKEDIIDYNNNPNFCLYCNNSILHDAGYLTHTKNKRFCSRSCAAFYNNAKRERKEKIKKIKENIDLFLSKTKKELLLSCKNYFSFRSTITKHARKVIKKSNKDLICNNCGYNKHVETCHIKSVSSFTDDSTIEEINNLKNLIYLCPNCHWEYDNNILKLNIK